MPSDPDQLVTVYILVWIQYPDGNTIGPFTQTFEVFQGSDVSAIDTMGQEIADSFLERYPLYGLAGEGEPFALWEVTAPLMYQYSVGD